VTSVAFKLFYDACRHYRKKKKWDKEKKKVTRK
jgi:hypothetical protein